jgi:hypothetical protein
MLQRPLERTSATLFQQIFDVLVQIELVHSLFNNLANVLVSRILVDIILDQEQIQVWLDFGGPILLYRLFVGYLLFKLLFQVFSFLFLFNDNLVILGGLVNL